MTNLWTTEEAIALCKLVEGFCPDYGFHVALTGGLLYKEGGRKDCDLVLYQIRQRQPDWNGFWKAAAAHGFDENPQCFGFVSKTHFNGKCVDFLWPEAPVGDYPVLDGLNHDDCLEAA